MNRPAAIRAVITTGMIAATLSAQADFSFTLTGAGVGVNGYALASSATFTFVDATDSFTVLLANTAGTEVRDPGNLLSGVFFSIAGSPSLTKVSATLGTGSDNVVKNNSVVSGGYNLNDEWAYKAGINPSFAPGSSYGISAVGLGIFGGADTFSGTGPSPSGDGFDICPATGTTPNAPSIKNYELVNHRMLFTFSTTASLEASDIANVRTHYGSGSEFATVDLVPEPLTLSSLAVGCATLLRRRRRG